MPIKHGGNIATVTSSWSRRTVRLNTALPLASTPCSEKTLFARSIPTVVIFSMTSPLVSD
jgi:hypothetical protein